MSQGTASIRNLTLIINDDDASKTTYDEYDWNYENDYNIYNSMSMGDILIIELKFFPFSITEIIQKSYPEHKYNLFIIPVVTFLDFWGFKDTSNSFINYITDIPIRDNYFGKLTPWRTCKLFFLDIEIMEVHHLSYPRKMIKIIPDALF